jgi:hypothetical protein
MASASGTKVGALRSRLVRTAIACSIGLISIGGTAAAAAGASGSVGSGGVPQYTTLPSTTTLSSSVNPSVFGQSVTFTATVGFELCNVSFKPACDPRGGIAPSPVRDGTVTFSVGGTDHDVALSSSNTATLTLANLPVGATSVQATYAGNADYNTSSSDPLSQQVNEASTTTTLSLSPNPVSYGSQETYTATVAAVSPGAGTPTGTVQFKDDGFDLGLPATLNGSGVASLTQSSPYLGTATITATYSGDSSFAGSSTSTGVDLGIVVSPPTGVVATAGVSSANVTWTAIDVRPQVAARRGETSPPRGAAFSTTYEVVAHDLTSGANGSPVDEGSSTTATLTGLTVGDAYNFTVVAVLSNGGNGARHLTGIASFSSAPSAPSNNVVPTSAAPQNQASGATSASIGTPGAAGSVQATASGGTGTVKVAEYAADPTGGFNGGGTFFDVSLSPGSTFTSLTITLCGVQSGGAVEWWNPITLGYEDVSDVTPGATAGCVDITVNASTTPSISQMYGTVLVVGAPATGAQLAFTGQDDLWLVPTGLGMLLVGSLLIFLSRRQRQAGRQAG